MQHNYKHCPKPKMPIHELTLHAGLPSQHVKAVSVWSRQVFLGHTLLKRPEAKNRTWSTTRQVRLTINPNFSSVKLPADIPLWYIVLRPPHPSRWVGFDFPGSRQVAAWPSANSLTSPAPQADTRPGSCTNHTRLTVYTDYSSKSSGMNLATHSSQTHYWGQKGFPHK